MRHFRASCWTTHGRPRSADCHRKVNYLPEVVEFLYYKQGGWLSVLFGNDERKLNGHYAVYYVLSMEKGTKCWITVRVEVDANKPEYPSVTPRVPAAVWASVKCAICTV